MVIEGYIYVQVCIDVDIGTASLQASLRHLFKVLNNDVVKCDSLVDTYDFMRCSQAILLRKTF